MGLPALVFATSCVPQDPPRAAASKVALKPDARTLLRRLALDVPTDAAAVTLPPVAAIEAPTAASVAAPAFLAQARSPQDFDRAQDCLTAAIYYEARSQTEDGQRAVAQVVLNRVRDLAFPNSVCGVVYQGSNRRTGCQFSFTCDGSMYRRRDDFAWERSRTVAAAALGGEVYAPVGTATHYHATSVLPWWASSLSRIGQVGAHIFYRWQSGMERALAFRQAYSGLEPQIGGTGPFLASPAVAIHYAALEMVGGVTVHRGTGFAAATTQAAFAGPTSMAGVRIHRGGKIPSAALLAAEDYAGDESDDAI